MTNGIASTFGGGELRRRGEIVEMVFERGFGNIVDDGGARWFFHASACDDLPFDDMRVGDGVTFVAAYSTKGPRALKVRRGEIERK